MDAVRTRRSAPPGRDAGSIVLGWLTKLTLTLAVVGLVGFEVLSIVVTHVTLRDVGTTAADAALTDFRERHDGQTSYEAAAAYAESQGATIPKRSFILNADGSVSFELRKTATTIVLYRIGPLAHYADVVVPIDQESIESTGSLP